MKLVVAAVNEAGRSYIETTRRLPDQAPFYVWEEQTLGNLSEMIGRLDPSTLAPHLEPPPGQFRWVYQVKPPNTGEAQPARATDAMHTSRTIDFDFVVKGRMHCILDEEVAELEAGDFIVLKAASHRWVNPSSTEETVIVYMLHTPADPTL